MKGRILELLKISSGHDDETLTQSNGSTGGVSIWRGRMKQLPDPIAQDDALSAIVCGICFLAAIVMITCRVFLE